jgi:inward rectifier potassium channel
MYEGAPHLMIRLANERSNRIVEAHTNMVLLRTVVTQEGHSMRRFMDLTTLRSNAPLIRFTWTVMHKIDENSPLYGLTQQDMIENETEIIVSLTGLDETLSQTIHARYSYIAEEIMFDARFEDVLVRNEDGRIEVNYEHFHTTTPFKLAA